jgi:hypothetical protein
MFPFPCLLLTCKLTVVGGVMFIAFGLNAFRISDNFALS